MMTPKRGDIMILNGKLQSKDVIMVVVAHI